MTDSRVRAEPERFDVVIVGARAAGCSTAITLARYGYRVLAIDRARFPSNVMSTHGCFPGHTKEMERLGVLDRVMREHAPPPLRWIQFTSADGESVREPWAPKGGLDYGICIGRPQLDKVLVDEARDRGVEVREGTPVSGLLWEDDRVVGVRYGRGGQEREVRASLVVGADGRFGPTAGWVGSARPYRASANGRGNFYWYLEDPKVGTLWRHNMAVWRGHTEVLAVPMPNDLMVVQLMPPVGEIPCFREEPEVAWEQTLRENRRVAERLDGAFVPVEKLKQLKLPRRTCCENITSYFRASSGPGWALVGDAGHVKDPLAGQGIRDALRYGRLLGEMVSPALEEPVLLDQQLRSWEVRRDHECLDTYLWGSQMSRSEEELEAMWSVIIRVLGEPRLAGDSNVTAAFSRMRNLRETVAPEALLHVARAALANPERDRRELVRTLLNDLRIESGLWVDSKRRGFRRSRTTAAERQGWVWPPEKPGRVEPAPAALRPEPVAA
ncbi:MAG: NAD(P)/FAD-dependent oxidoreductase [Solirubrobacteraceae bacterium]